VHVSKTNHGQSFVTVLCSDSAYKQNKTKLRGSTRNAGRINPWYPNKSRGNPGPTLKNWACVGWPGNGLGRHGQNPPPLTDTRTCSLFNTHTHQHRLHNMQVLDLRRLRFWQRASIGEHLACVYNRRCRGSWTCGGLSRRQGAATQEKPGYLFFDRLSLRIPPRSI